MRRSRVPFVAAVVCAGAVLVPASAEALAGGQPVADGADRFAVKVSTEGAACSGALIAPQWIVTAAACLPGATAQPAAPAKPVTVYAGQPDLRSANGQVLRVSTVVARADRDIALAKLTHPVADVTPLKVGSRPPAAETVRAVGFGRTATEWVPNRLTTASFTLGAATATTVAVTSPAGQDPCLGDAGGPLLRPDGGGGLELAGVLSRSWQHGCLAVTETRQGAVAARTDDLAGWIADQVAPRSLRFVNHNSKRCLAVQGANNVDDAPAFQFDCPGAYADQAWDLEPQATGGLLLRNQATKRCLIVHAAGSGNGTPLQQYECLPQFTDQLWDIVGVDGGVQIKNRATGRCAVVFGANNTNGAGAAQYDCLPQFSDQVWETAPVPDPVQVVNRASGRCLIVHGANNADDAPVFQYDCLPQFSDQAWEIDPQAGGGVLVRNHYTKKCLIVHGANNVNGAQLLQYECLPQFTDQLWDVVAADGHAQLKNRATGRCAGVAGTGNDITAAQYDCTPQSGDRVWDVLPYPAGH
ncbi:RICIN domain-containing protein [Amycolatopsis sp. Hca4]|uniref:RICIN domain-containing protein n=1 Tax=Amycolatopsis sp. Hca4 TaxID=2742131 RepID=UPI001592226D|nr:RICIN domain-containing protein [Amycolatopsis sp. Hca4]QKV80057.1 RICIN domain-containing protein [Amycolatopsis sp. Hca4]